MRISLIPALLGVALAAAGQASAAPCFDQSGRALSHYEHKECEIQQEFYRRPSHDQVLAYDDKLVPLFYAHVEGKKSKTPGLKTIRTPDGRLLTPAQFENVYVVTPRLGVGEVDIDRSPRTDDWRAFLIDLETGAIRPTPYVSVLRTDGVFNADAPYLAGVLQRTFHGKPTRIDVLHNDGSETGLVMNIDETMITTHPHGIVGWRDQLYTLSGDTPAGGRLLWQHPEWGYFAAIGSLPSEMGGKPGPLYVPLDESGQTQAPPPDVVGIAKGWGGALWVIRRAADGLNFQEHVSGRLSLANPPSGQVYSGLYITDHFDALKTANGWVTTNDRKVYATFEEVKQRETYLSSFVAAVLEEERMRPLREAEARAQAAALAQQQYWTDRAAVSDRIRQARAERWTGAKMDNLVGDVKRLGLEEEYIAAGLYVDPSWKTQICMYRAASICDYSASASPSSSGYVSTWEQAFENARNLNQSQYNENCAAADMGASRICTRY